MFYLSKPTDDRISRVLQNQRDAPFSYGEVGASRDPPERLAGYAVDRNRVKLGEGREAFDRAVAGLLSWKMFEVGWARLVPVGASTEIGTTVGVLARHYGLWSLNVSRVVYGTREDDGPVVRRGFAYGTLSEHAESGEERFTVEWHRDSDAVVYDLYAFSRPNHAFARLGRPAARRLQRRFARDSLRAMREAVIPG